MLPLPPLELDLSGRRTRVKSVGSKAFIVLHDVKRQGNGWRVKSRKRGRRPPGASPPRVAGGWAREATFPRVRRAHRRVHPNGDTAMPSVTPNKLELALRAYDHQLVEARAISTRPSAGSIDAAEHAGCGQPFSLDSGIPPHAPPVLAAGL